MSSPTLFEAHAPDKPVHVIPCPPGLSPEQWHAYTPDQQEGITHAASKLVSRGYSYPFAIQVAAEQAGPRTVPEPVHYDAGEGTEVPSPPSDGYEAVKQDDGKWTIRGVEIFAEHERDGFEVNRDWLEQAVRRAAQRAQEGYRPPLHIKHHGNDREPELAGHFSPRTVEDREYDGKPTAVVVADLEDVPQEAYERIKGGEFPYRSVEILDLGTPEIDSLALLDHEVPFFRFRNLKPVEGEPVALSAGPAVRYQADGDGHYLMFDFGSAHYMPPPMGNGGGQPAPQPQQQMDPRQAVAQMAQQLMAMAQKLQSLVGGGQEQEQPQMGGPVDMSAETDAAVTGQADITALASLQGQIDALKARSDKAEAEKATADRVKEAEKALARYAVTEDVRSNLHRYAEAGEEAISAYVEAVKTHGTPDPVDDFGAGAFTPSSEDEAIVMRFAEHGPEALVAARHKANEYASAPASLKGRATLEEYLKANLPKEWNGR